MLQTLRPKDICKKLFIPSWNKLVRLSLKYSFTLVCLPAIKAGLFYTEKLSSLLQQKSFIAAASKAA